MASRMKITRELMKSGNQKLKQFKPQILEAQKKTKWNILRGDTVQVTSRIHPEYGKQGVVREVLRSKDRVIVEGVNIAPRRIKGDPDKGTKGKTIQTERTIHYSNVNLVDPVTGRPTRVTRKYLDDGTKVRVSKKSGAIIPRPDILALRRRPVDTTTVTESDTTGDEDVWEITYVPQE
mmetsp:Transcript_3108/g.4377  ORF Transcript_3108/g.4377 Transcript_3108/m.4377 type:complete len:178 (-) Transcript_3108:125-658(-)|eukprot:CAMPEP_0184854964 /NCGR_PEP_ID=MMETSP0580-20130426/326_1 /TAXON_ID=1118495 /ORGANISM="Dactyliosolen fragilissimus" /LENGTH=177 /DNA_ID=CAMNT_0027349353 /DNA_START=143 /DNA_END=676 /DNA_ORIENTATION=+